MIRPIGEIFEDNGVKLKVVKCPACDGCYYKKGFDCGNDDDTFEITGECSAGARTDSVIFKEVK